MLQKWGEELERILSAVPALGGGRELFADGSARIRSS